MARFGIPVDNSSLFEQHFVWNAAKAASNNAKHGVAFEEAQTVFQDEHAQLFYDNDHSDDEDREIIVGYSEKARLLVVSFTERGHAQIRIISARIATTQERKIYANQSSR